MSARHQPQISLQRWLAYLLLTLVLLFASLAAIGVASLAASAHAAPHVIGAAAPHTGCGGAILGC